MKYTYIRNSQGVALLAALFVLMVLSILGIGLLTNVDDEIKMNKSAENSEMALKVAEAGIQVARSTFFDSTDKEITTTAELSSIDRKELKMVFANKGTSAHQNYGFRGGGGDASGANPNTGTSDVNAAASAALSQNKTNPRVRGRESAKVTGMSSGYTAKEKRT